MLFNDRTDAGTRLGQKLMTKNIDKGILVALPRGGLPVAAAAAEITGWPLAVFVSRKLRCPWQPELAFGAVTQSGTTWFNEPLIAALGIDTPTRTLEIERQTVECKQRQSLFARCQLPPGDFSWTPVVVDDGAATGATMLAAVKSLKESGYRQVLCAVPVASVEGSAALDAASDGMITLDRPDGFLSVGQFYIHFPQISDAQAVAICDGSNRCFKPAAG